MSMEQVVTKVSELLAGFTLAECRSTPNEQLILVFHGKDGKQRTMQISSVLTSVTVAKNATFKASMQIVIGDAPLGIAPTPANVPDVFKDAFEDNDAGNTSAA